MTASRRRTLARPGRSQTPGAGSRVRHVSRESNIACLGHAQHARHGGDWEAGLVRAHEPEGAAGTAPVSSANQASAFDRMPRSSRSCLFSRYGRVNSSRQTLASPEPPPPVGPLACQPQPPTRRSIALSVESLEQCPRMIVQNGPDHHLTAELRRIRRTRLEHQERFCKSFRVSTKPGQSQLR